MSVDTSDFNAYGSFKQSLVRDVFYFCCHDLEVELVISAAFEINVGRYLLLKYYVYNYRNTSSLSHPSRL